MTLKELETVERGSGGRIPAPELFMARAQPHALQPLTVYPNPDHPLSLLSDPN